MEQTPQQLAQAAIKNAERMTHDELSAVYVGDELVGKFTREEVRAFHIGWSAASGEVVPTESLPTPRTFHYPDRSR